MILEIDNIELSFSEKTILNGIYLKAETGKITGILGSNGCGKSSLLKIIFGVLKPKYKLLRIDNKPVLKPLFSTKLVSYLPQHNFTPNRIKVKVLFELLNVDWVTFLNEFEHFLKYKSTKINLLSGGERRVLETYLVLKGSARILLLDEPFSHIAPLYIEQIKALIAQEKKRKVIIITDHLYEHMIEASDKLYLLKNGHSKLMKNSKELEFYNYVTTGTFDQSNSKVN